MPAVPKEMATLLLSSAGSVWLLVRSSVTAPVDWVVNRLICRVSLWLEFP